MKVKFTYEDKEVPFTSTLAIEWWNRPIIIFVRDKIDAIKKAREFYREQVDKVNHMRKALEEFEGGKAMSDRVYTKEDIDKIKDNFILFTKIFFPDFELTREEEDLAQRFLDVEAKEMRRSWEL